jgi:hypothetical protein
MVRTVAGSIASSLNTLATDVVSANVTVQADASTCVNVPCNRATTCHLLRHLEARRFPRCIVIRSAKIDESLVQILQKIHIDLQEAANLIPKLTVNGRCLSDKGANASL